jgi:putative CocE/NonD family hydrolase
MRRCLFLFAVIGLRAYPQPATLAGFSDSGTFAIYANEDRLGTLAFEWKPNGSFEAKVVIAIDKQEAVSTVSLTPDAEGRWVKAVLRGLRDSTTTTWESDGKTLHFTSSDTNGKGDWPLDSLTFEGYTPPLMTQALRRYDAAAGGAQDFSVILLDLSTLDHRTLTVERLETRDYNIGPRRIALTRWAFTPPGHDYRILAGPDGKVYAGSGIDGMGPGGISPHHALFVREGYESLLAELDWTEQDKTRPISRPTFDVEIRRGTWISMRDGVKLSTDLYLPKGASKSPVVLVRTPYKKELIEPQGRFFARRGYVFAVQDVRGRFASQGEWTPLIHEAKDGYDSIEWLARQPWSTGKVGMIGASYLGWVQWLAASLHPPHLAAMIPNVSPPDPFHNVPWDSGVLELSALSWADTVESNATADITGAAMARSDAKKNYGLDLPIVDMDKAVLGAESRYWRDWIAHPTPDKYWAGAMFLEKLRKFDIPVFHQSGWFDGDGIGTKLNYLKMAAFGHKNQKLTIGPWEHSDTSSQIAFRHDYGPAAAIDLQRDYLRWFDRWLKGMDNGIDREPAVSLFAMGSDKWIYGPSYPLPQTRFEKLYLGAGGVLSFEIPDAGQPPDKYTYDPGDPTPEGEIYGEHRLEMEQARKDLLLYTTAPFEKPYTFAGPVSAVLYAASSARDTDWFVHVLDIDEKGTPSTLWANASGGHIRARYRNSLTKPELLVPGRIYEYKIDLWHTALTVQPGHRLRIEVMSAGFPAHGRNLNTGGNNETEATFVNAYQTIYHDSAHPSHILLPAIDH